MRAVVHTHTLRAKLKPIVPSVTNLINTMSAQKLKFLHKLLSLAPCGAANGVTNSWARFWSLLLSFYL